MENFRDDTKEMREARLYKNDLLLDLVDESIAIFERETMAFINYDNQSES